jgi:hypothetical protein
MYKIKVYTSRVFMRTRLKSIHFTINHKKIKQKIFHALGRNKKNIVRGTCELNEKEYKELRLCPFFIKCLPPLSCRTGT